MQSAWKIDEYLESVENHLRIDGVDAMELAGKFGTPLFVISEQRIRHNISMLTAAARTVWPRTKLCYATKANSQMAVLDSVRRAEMDIEVNSGGELYKALRAGFKGGQIVFNGVSKTAAEIEEAIDAEIFAINVDSSEELRLIVEVARRIGKRANISFRLVPEIGTRSHIGLQTALFTSKFGISSSQLQDYCDEALRHGDAVNLRGLHIHVGSQTPNINAYERAFLTLYEHRHMLEQRTGHRLDHLNLGGGIPVNYLRGDPQMDQFGEHEQDMLGARLDFGEVFRKMLGSAGPDVAIDSDLTIVFELGRSVVADAGVLLSRVCNLKTRPETRDQWLLIDAGFNLTLSIVTYGWYYHSIAADRADEPHVARYKLAGPLCDSGDVYFDLAGEHRMPAYRLLPEKMAVGDVIALLSTGAYTLSQELAVYNERIRTPVVLIRADGAPTVIRPRGSYDDLLANERW